MRQDTDRSARFPRTSRASSRARGPTKGLEAGSLRKGRLARGSAAIIDRLEALGNIRDFIGGIAVVATLLFLAAQIRQNTNALQIASRQAISSGYRESNRLRLDPETGRAGSKGLPSFSELSFAKRHLFSTAIIDEALFFQDAFALHESGQLEEATYPAYLDWFSSVISTPGGSHWWEITARPIFTPGVIASVDARLSTRNLLDVRELPGLWLSFVLITRQN